MAGVVSPTTKIQRRVDDESFQRRNETCQDQQHFLHSRQNRQKNREMCNSERKPNNQETPQLPLTP
jgi:hypothetical protein